MTAEDQTNWLPEQLEEWAKPALEHPELVEIARTATSNNQAKKEALKWITKTHEDLGQACRWARILRVEHPERFEKLVSQNEQKPKPEEKEMKESKIRITLGGMLDEIEIGKWPAMKLCNELLSGIVKSDAIDELMVYPPHTTAGASERDLLRTLIVQILREKFKVEIKCRNCRFLHESLRDPKHARGCTKNPDHPDLDLTAEQHWLRKEENLDDYCLCWEPKEVSGRTTTPPKSKTKMMPPHFYSKAGPQGG